VGTGCASSSPSDNPFVAAGEAVTTTRVAATTTVAASGPPTTVGATTTRPTTTTTIARPAADALRDLPLGITHVADVDKATSLVTRPADGSIYVTSQPGQVYRIADGGAPALVLDLSGTVSEWAPGSERGLLGMAFSPVDGRLFLYYTDLQAQAHLVSYAVADDGTPDPDSVWTVMDIAQPGAGHKGGSMSIDDGGVLYLALGDGGGSRGRDAQDYTKPLGGIVRIVPNTTGPGYTVPADNPFVGDPDKMPELWAKGLRNPWGFWRDPATGDLWVSDVGEDTVEELNRISAATAGANFGWYFIEGDNVRYQGAPADAVHPVFTYRHDQVGPAIIGGRVYRGAAIPSLDDAYVFADMAGTLFAMGAGDQVTPLGVSLPEELVTGFGLGPDGELYIITLRGGVYELVPGDPN
jgi:glucose/arabinose dehydrogenase